MTMANPANATTPAMPSQQPYQHGVYPDARGRFGDFGGRFVPESLMAALDELEGAYTAASSDPDFMAELAEQERTYSGRPTPLYFAARLSARVGARVYLKREDLAHTGAHKINNALGQGLLARRMGKRRIIAETGAGQHGVAAATVCAKLGLECIVYMGEEDIQRQSLNVFRMKLLGAEVRPVGAGSRTLKDAINEAIRDWVTNVETTHYLIGSAVGPHPYPRIVRDFQSVIGRETRAQILDATGRLPALVVACVGGGSNAIGMFHPFAGDEAMEHADGVAERIPRDAEARGGLDAAVIAQALRIVVAGPAIHDPVIVSGHLRDHGANRNRRVSQLTHRVVSQAGGTHQRRLHQLDGAGGVPGAQPGRGHHPGAGVGARRRSRAGAGRGRRAGPRRGGGDLPLWPRRQGY